MLVTCPLLAQNFEAQYTDTTGLQWSQNIGMFTNGCRGADLRNNEENRLKCTVETDEQGNPLVDVDGTYMVKSEDSEASQACRKIGARLPTRTEILNLIRDPGFDYKETKAGPVLTNSGKKTIRFVFPDMNGEWFWSSSVVPDNTIGALFLDIHWGRIESLDNRRNANSVRCVRPL